VTRRPIDHFISWVAALACLSFVVVLSDVMLRPIELSAPPPPVLEAKRDALLAVEVVTTGGKPLPGAKVRVFWERDGRYYLAGSSVTDAQGRVHFSDLPRGKVWILADAEGYARGSTQLVVGPKERQTRLELSAEHHLQVKVQDDAGTPIIQATVLVRTADPLPFGALTDTSGVAKLGRLPAPPWTVQVSARGYESVTREDVKEDITVTLRRLGSLEVYVSDPEGRPAEGATVWIAGSSLWPARKAETNAAGVTRIVGLLAGVYELKAVRGSLVSDTMFGLELARGQDKRVELRLQPGRMVTVIVTDGDEENAVVVPSADVLLAESGISSFPLRGRTGQDGTVTLGPIAPGPATLAAAARDFVPRVAVPVPEPLEGPVRIALLRGATVRGEIVDSRGFPIDGASIEIIGSDVFGLPVMQTPFHLDFGRAHFDWALSGPMPLIPAGELGVMPGPIPPIPGAAGSSLDTTSLSAGVQLGSLLESQSEAERTAPWVSEVDGTFVAQPVSPGRVHALARHPDYVEGLSDLMTLAPGGEAKVRIVLYEGGMLEGRILDDRNFPVAGARVDVAAVQGTWERMTLTSTDGSYAFAAVPSQAVVSVARPEELGRIVVRRAVSVEPGRRTELDINLPAPREAVTVRVVDDQNTAVAGAQVTLLSVDPDVPLRQTLFTSESGEVTFEDAAGVALRVQAEAPGWIRVSKTFSEAPARIELELLRGVLIEGRVTAVRGRMRVSGATVTVASEAGRQVAITNDEGVYRVSDVAPGNVQIVVSHPEYAEGQVAAKVEPTTRGDRPFEVPAIDLSEAGDIEGQVVDAKGEPVLGARVAVGLVPAYMPVGALPPGMATTDRAGRFKLGGVPPGSVELEAYAAGVGRGRVRNVTVHSDRTTRDVRIQLTPTEGGEGPPLGASVAVTLAAQGDDIVVVHVAAASEAERAGLRAGDVLLAIDDVEPTSLKAARARLGGPQRSDVVLEIARGGQELKLRIARELVRQ
jgi:protocatechuate 3,4-dioxygenase beta subunit